MQLQALRDNIIVKPDKYPEKIGSIYTPESKKRDRTNFGVVISVGKDLGDVSIGDKVFFSKFHGTEFVVNGVRYLRLEKEDVDGVIG